MGSNSGWLKGWVAGVDKGEIVMVRVMSAGVGGDCVGIVSSRQCWDFSM